MKIHDVVIIGAGPAGIAAAIQLKRSGVEPLLLEKEWVGGLLRNANLVENYPGFPAGISGVDLVGLMVEQMNRLGVRPVHAEVRSLRHEGDIPSAGARFQRRDAYDPQAGIRSPRTGRGTFRLEVDGDVLHARFAVLASGTEGIVPDNLVLPGALLGRLIFHEVMDVSPREDDRVAIIGGGDCAFDYALNLANSGCRVSILHRGDRPGALALLVERVSKEPRIDYVPGVEVKGIEEVGDGLVLQLLKGPVDYLEVDRLLLAVGRRPRVGFVSPGILAGIESGEKIGGLCVAGDVRRGFMRQVGIAVGDGLAAAMEIAGKSRG